MQSWELLFYLAVTEPMALLEGLVYGLVSKEAFIAYAALGATIGAFFKLRFDLAQARLAAARDAERAKRDAAREKRQDEMERERREWVIEDRRYKDEQELKQRRAAEALAWHVQNQALDVRAKLEESQQERKVLFGVIEQKADAAFNAANNFNGKLAEVAGVAATASTVAKEALEEVKQVKGAETVRLEAAAVVAS